MPCRASRIIVGFRGNAPAVCNSATAEIRKARRAGNSVPPFWRSFPYAISAGAPDKPVGLALGFLVLGSAYRTTPLKVKGQTGRIYRFIKRGKAGCAPTGKATGCVTVLLGCELAFKKTIPVGAGKQRFVQCKQVRFFQGQGLFENLGRFDVAFRDDGQLAVFSH